MTNRDLTISEAGLFLRFGALLGLGLEKCLVAWGEPERFNLANSNTPNSNDAAFYVPDFYLEDAKPWARFENMAITRRDHLATLLSEFSNQPQLDIRWQPPGRSEFAEKFELVQNAIRQNIIRKAVPVVFAHAKVTLTASMRAKAIRSLLLQAKKPIPYGFWTPEEGVLGATPEKLFNYNVREGVLETMALAGTRSSALEATKSLVNDPKEMFEHDLVIKGLKEKLKPFGDLKVSPTYVWDLGPISHLRTDISVEFDRPPAAENSFTEMCALLHPTAALGVSPNNADWRFLKKCDGTENRLRFGAPFGFLQSAGSSQALVAIRNIQWRGDELLLGTGCGVVEQSQFENEWQELEIKRNSVRALLGL